MKITVTTNVTNSIKNTWELWNTPYHIMRWNQASTDWHTSYAENDLKTGGSFLSRMESRDGKMSFDFEGAYLCVKKEEEIEYEIPDGRNVRVEFREEEGITVITETFDTENTNPVELQRAGWQAILDSFAKYAGLAGNGIILRYSVSIQRRPEDVMAAMISEPGYKYWTSAFNESSHYEGSWEKGKRISSVGMDANGKKGGMISSIKELIPGKFLSIEHTGLIENGEEITNRADVEKWKGMLENYYFRPVNELTEVTIEMGSIEGFDDYFNKTWPVALNRLKSYCENSKL
jgi:uncharacterized protein YndB with AHSA1/START domain